MFTFITTEKIHSFCILHCFCNSQEEESVKEGRVKRRGLKRGGIRGLIMKQNSLFVFHIQSNSYERGEG